MTSKKCLIVLIISHLGGGAGSRFFETHIHKLPKNRFLAISQDRTKDILKQAELEKRSALQNLLLDISADFINDFKTFGNHINETMARLGQAVECDRMYIFVYDFDAALVHNTYEWCKEGISPEIENLQNVPLDQVDAAWMRSHKEGQPHEILDVSALPSQSELKPILESQGIKSLLTVPLGRGDDLHGFVGFDWVKDHFKPFSEQINLLKIFADLYHSTMLQQTFVKQIELQNTFSSELIEKISTPLVVINKKGAVENANTAFCDLMQLSKADIVGKLPPYPWWPAESASELEVDFNSFMDSDTFKQELTFQRANNERFPALVVGRRLQNREGLLRYATVEDLSEREKVVQSLKETENWLAISQRSARLAHFIYNLTTREFEASNQLRKLLGLEDSYELDEPNWWQLIPELHRRKYNQQLQEAIDERRPINLNVELIRPSDRAKIWLNVEGIINYSRSGEAIDLQGTIRDVSKEMGYIKRIEKQNQRLKEIAWLQSHELRAPLVRIMSLSDALSASGGQVEEYELLGLIKSAATDMDEVIGKLVRKAESFGLSDEDLGIDSDHDSWEVIVVDDDPIINKLAVVQLNALKLNSDIKSFATGSDFLSYVRDELIERSEPKLMVVLLDINMPDVNGWDVLNFISQEGLEGKIQVAMFSSSISASDKKKAMEFSFVREFIEKPLQKEVLKELLDNLNLI